MHTEADKKHNSIVDPSAITSHKEAGKLSAAKNAPICSIYHVFMLFLTLSKNGL